MEKTNSVCISRRGEVTRKYLRQRFALDKRDVMKFWRNAIEEMVARKSERGSARAPPEGAGRLFFDSFRRETCMLAKCRFFCLPSPLHPLQPLFFASFHPTFANTLFLLFVDDIDDSHSHYRL